MNTKLNKSDYLLLAVYFTISILFSVIDYYQRGALMREYWIDFPIELLFTFALIFLFMYWLIPKYIVKHKRYFSFACWSLFFMGIFGIVQKYTGFWSGNNDWNKFPSTFSLILEGISMSANDMSLPFGLLLTKKFYETQSEFLKIEKQQKENELKLLRSQIDPHFLFNNLNTLDSLIDSDSEKAKEYINRLSLIYRYLIKTKDAEIMELSEEVQLAENYIFLIKTRFENDYDFQINIKTKIVDKFLPTGAIQALLENVVKHNKPQNGKSIKTTIFIDDNKLMISNMKSNMKSKTESFGTGLENLKTRYQLLSNRKVVINDFKDEFIISIPIIKLIN